VDVIPVSRIEGIEKIEDYKLIILTGNDGIDLHLRNLLQEFLDKGGKVLSVKDVSSLSGSGFSYIEDSEREEIMKNGFCADFIGRVNMSAGKPQIMVEGADYILGNVMVKMNGSKMFVHIVNYSDKIAGDVNLKVYMDNLEIERGFNSVKYESPDDAEFKVLRNDRDYVEIGIKNLDTYGVVVLQ